MITPMRLRPFAWLWIGIAVAILFFGVVDFGSIPDSILREVVTRESARVDTVWVSRETRIPVPVDCVKVVRVILRDTVVIDSMASGLEAELEECRRRYDAALSALYASGVGDTLDLEQGLSVYKDTVYGDGYDLAYEIGTMGRLNHFYPSVRVKDVGHPGGFGLSAGIGVNYMTKGVGMGVGVSYTRSSTYGLLFMPTDGTVLFTVSTPFKSMRND